MRSFTFGKVILAALLLIYIISCRKNGSTRTEQEQAKPVYSYYIKNESYRPAAITLKKLKNHPDFPGKSGTIPFTYIPEVVDLQDYEKKEEVTQPLKVTTINADTLFFTIPAQSTVSLGQRLSRHFFENVQIQFQNSQKLSTDLLENTEENTFCFTIKEKDINIKLIRAIGQNNFETTAELLKKGADVNAIDIFSNSALMNAVFNYDITALLLENGADADAVNNSSTTALMEAAAEGKTDITQLLLEKGATIDMQDDTGRTALAWAFIGSVYGAGTLPAAQVLIRAGADITIKDQTDQTMLMYAAMGGNPEMVKFLLAKGLDINAKDASNNTALYHSLYNTNDPSIAEYLITRGIELDTIDNEGWSTLMTAIVRDNKKIAQILIRKRIHIDNISKEGTNALMLASYRGHIDIVRQLIALGVDPDLKDKEGKTALDHAKEENHTHIVRLLEKYRKN